MASGASLGSSSARCRITLCVSNVANRGLAPMSSATISTLDRQVWSSVAQLRWSRRPVTSGLIPGVGLQGDSQSGENLNRPALTEQRVLEPGRWGRKVHVGLERYGCGQHLHTQDVEVVSNP